jgi:hypothetical protein
MMTDLIAIQTKIWMTKAKMMTIKKFQMLFMITVNMSRLLIEQMVT